MILLAVTAGCGDRGPEVRRYREISSMPAPPAQPGALSAPPAAPAAPVAWTVPEGWEERPGGNMRIATFLTADGLECTLTAFPGDVGGMEANARRWLGQLNMEPPEDLAGFLEAAGTLSTDTGLAGRILDFRTLVSGGGDAMLAGVIEKDGFTIFVKLTAPAEVLASEEERFRTLCRSIR